MWVLSYARLDRRSTNEGIASVGVIGIASAYEQRLVYDLGVADRPIVLEHDRSTCGGTSEVERGVREWLTAFAVQTAAVVRSPVRRRAPDEGV